MKFLNIHDTLKICKEILSSLSDLQVEYQSNYCYHFIAIPFDEISQLYIRLEWNDSIKEYELKITLHFAVTVPQARAFYQNVKYSQIADLLSEEKKWQATYGTNVILGFATASIIQYIESGDEKSYFEYWKNDGYSNIGRMGKHEALTLFRKLNEASILDFSSDNEAEFQSNFMDTDKSTVDIKPSFGLEHIISQQMFIEKDRNETLLNYLKEKIVEVLSSLGIKITFLK